MNRPVSYPAMPILLLLTVFSLFQTAPGAEVSTASLLGQMTDLESLAEPPRPAYDSVQFSSYDRRSKAPFAPGWFENSDGFGNEPVPNVLETLLPADNKGVGRYLIALVEGPGAVVRTWTAKMDGELTVWLDDAESPVYNGNANDFMMDRPACLGGAFEKRMPGFTQVDANYFPVAFAKKLRIEWTGRLSELHFYHIGVRRYAPGTAVAAFSAKDLDTERETIIKTSGQLAAPGAAFQPQGEKRGFSVACAPDKRETLLALDGGGKVVEFALRAADADPQEALRRVVLLGFFDGAAIPQIETPLGAFFASWPGITPYDSLPVTVGPDGLMVCRFVMPFAASASFAVVNHGGTTAALEGWVVVKPLDTPDVPWHFRAKWRVDHGLDAGGGEGSMDLDFLTALGPGSFVGAVSHVTNPTPVLTIGGSWWGEGDEKIWVDSSQFPVFFGTGSEDYYNYSWSRIDLFSHAYCAEPVATGPGCGGFTTNLRWHILDALPFNSRFAFAMELMHHSATPNLSYGRTSYYYAPPETRDATPRIRPEDVRRDGAPPVVMDYRLAGPFEEPRFMEAESLLSKDAANTLVAENPLFLGGKALWWDPKQEGGTLALVFTIPETGNYHLGIVHLLSPDSGRYGAILDDKKVLLEQADLFSPHLTLLRMHQTPPLHLEKGEHTITLSAKGKNELSSGTRVGVDLLWTARAGH